MNKNFDLLADSCCDLPVSLLEEQDVQFVSMTVQMGGKEYRDDLGKTFDYQEFVKRLKSGEMATTSQINIGTYLEAFKPYVDQEQPLLYLSFSSGLSGSYQNAISAVNLLKEDYQNVPITVVDTKAASLGLGLIVKCVSELRLAGGTLEETLEWLDNHLDNVQSWVTVDNLEHLERGGRISKTSAAIGGLMKINPIIHVNDEGKLINVGKARGRHRAISKIILEMQKHATTGDHSLIYVVHADDLESALKTKELLEQEYPTSDIQIYPMGPTIMSHTGTGTLAIFTFGDKR